MIITAAWMGRVSLRLTMRQLELDYLLAVDEIDEFAAELARCPVRVVLKPYALSDFTKSTYGVVIDAVHADAARILHRDDILATDC